VSDPLVATPILERTVAAVLDRQARERPDTVAVVDERGGTRTYVELQRAAFSVATALTKLGVQRQEPVLVMLDNHLDNVAVFLGAGVGGTIHVPVNTAYKGDILHHVVENSGARVIVIEGAACDRFAAVAAELSAVETVVVRGEPNAALPPAWRTVDFAELLDAEPIPPCPAAVWDVAAIIYTSGTEGPSKGVLCPHGHAFSMASFPGWLGPDDVVLVTLPLFHAGGLWAGLYNALRSGATAVIYPTFSASRFWDDVRRVGCTYTLMFGPMIPLVCAQPARPDDADNPLQLVTAIPAPATLDEFSARFGVDVISSYGMTEAGTVCWAEPGEVRPFVCGRPRDFVDIRLVDDRDVDVAEGQVGEIIMRSREPWSMMLGYHRMPEATVHAWRNLWLHSGDAAYRNEAGQLVFVDRKKDALRRRGENVSSLEVEKHILARPEVAEVAIVAVPSDLGEDEIKAVLILKAGCPLDPVAMLEDLVQRLPYFMVPRYYEVVESMPRTPTHKVQKTELRRRGVTPSTWDCEAAGFRVTRDGLRPVTPVTAEPA
jgi:crotonobetaine/carnitine-CoA ligase